MTDATGHWRPIRVIRRCAAFTASDPYLGQGHQMSDADFAQIWAPRGYAFLVLYPASRQAGVSSVLAAAGRHRAAAYSRHLALLRSGQLDASPAGTPASAAGGYRALAMAWDERIGP